MAPRPKLTASVLVWGVRGDRELREYLLPLHAAQRYTLRYGIG